jgi:HEAT repeat protein
MTLRELAEKYADLEQLIEQADDRPETAARLLNHLDDSSETVRMMACRACRAFPIDEDLNIKLLSLVDNDPDNEVRYEALRALGAIVSEGDLWSVADENFDVEQSKKIRRLFNRTRAVLSGLLQDPGRCLFERYGAVEALGSLGGEDWVAPLIGELWYSNHDKAKLSALIAVTASCHKRWTSLVKDALNEQNEVLFQWAMLAAGALRLRDAEDLICRVAADKKKAEELRLAALEALAALNTKRSRETLTKVAQNTKDKLCLEARGRIDEMAFCHKLLSTKKLAPGYKS